jgi:hypothetical protein
MGATAALAAIEGAKLVTGLVQAKKASSAVNKAAEQQRQAELKARADMQQAFQQQQQAVSPYLFGGPVMQNMAQYAWNPQTRQPMGPGANITMAGLFPGMSQPTPPPPPAFSYGTGTTAQPDKMQLSDLMDAGMSSFGANRQSMFMRDPQTLMVREVPWDQVSMLRSRGWTPVQSGGR